MKKKVLMPLIIAAMLYISACGSDAPKVETIPESALNDTVKVRVIREEGNTDPIDGNELVEVIEEDGIEYFVYRTSSSYTKERMDTIESIAYRVINIFAKEDSENYN